MPARQPVTTVMPMVMSTPAHSSRMCLWSSKYLTTSLVKTFASALCFCCTAAASKFAFSPDDISASAHGTLKDVLFLLSPKHVSMRDPPRSTLEQKTFISVWQRPLIWGFRVESSVSAALTRSTIAKHLGSLMLALCWRKHLTTRPFPESTSLHKVSRSALHATLKRALARQSLLRRRITPVTAALQAGVITSLWCFARQAMLAPSNVVGSCSGHASLL
mmetsp:Transcript_69178/g.148054  ORF Transcript_69178/g.148054 Transcript_69178/m.148054 type:complete len:219 (+) Transcript_69178:144-800(+)